MAMSHDACTHPRTPAGRAACRKARLANGTPNPIKTTTPARGKSTPAKVAATFKAPAIDAKIDAALPAPKSARNPDGLGKASLADLPGVFRTVVQFATERHMRHDVYTKRGQTMVDLIADHGTLTLTWNTATPNGVHAVTWRPAGTSVASRMATVNDGLTKLKGE